jgi:MFS family permease
MSLVSPPQAESRRGTNPAGGRGIIAVCLLAGALPLADLGVMNVAVPSVAADLDLGATTVKALIAVYTLAFGVILVPGGRLGDRFGRRRLFRIGLALFGLGALASALAPGPAWLLTARALQGAAAGLISPQVGGLLQVAFTGQRRARALGALGSSIAVSTAVGPLLGGLLIGLAGPNDTGGSWRWALAVDLLAFVPLSLSYLLPGPTVPGPTLPGPTLPGPTVNENRDLDPVATVLLALTALCLLIPVVTTLNLTAIGWWSVAAVLIVTLVRWERRYARSGRLPLLSGELLRNRAWVRGCAVIACFLAASTTLPVLISLHSQGALGLDALHAGLLMIPYAIGSAIGAALGGRWVLRLGNRLPVIGLLLFAGTLLLSLVVGLPTQPGTAAIGWLALLAVIGFATGIVITPNQTLSYQGVPSAQASNASGLLLTAQRLGSAVGIALATALFFGDTDPDGLVAAVVLLVGFTLAALLLTAAFSFRRRVSHA